MPPRQSPTSGVAGAATVDRGTATLWGGVDGHGVARVVDDLHLGGRVEARLGEQRADGADGSAEGGDDEVGDGLLLVGEGEPGGEGADGDDAEDDDDAADGEA